MKKMIQTLYHYTRQALELDSGHSRAFVLPLYRHSALIKESRALARHGESDVG